MEKREEESIWKLRKALSDIINYIIFFACLNTYDNIKINNDLFVFPFDRIPSNQLTLFKNAL